MKRIRVFVILLAVILLAACTKKEDQATGTGDVLVVSKQVGSTTVYGLSIFAYTLSSFSSVTAVSSADPSKTYTLVSNGGFKTSFYYETPESEFSTTKPVASTFNFSATFENGVKQVFKNTLTDAILPIPTFEKCAYNATTHQLEMNWTTITEAKSYAINILDGSKIVFHSPELANGAKPAYALRADGGGWEAGFKPENGKTYTVRLFAYMYEPGGGTSNIQSISIADKTVVWGN